MSVFTTPYTRKDNADRRSVKITWTLGEITAEDGRPATAVAQLSVIHNKDRKQFIASVMRVDVRSEGAFNVEMFQVMTGTRVSLPSMPAARFSAKALDAAVDIALAEILRRADDEDLVAVADPTSPA